MRIFKSNLKKTCLKGLETFTIFRRSLHLDILKGFKALTPTNVYNSRIERYNRYFNPDWCVGS